MTSKAVIINMGPDAMRVRQVCYDRAAIAKGEPAIVVADELIAAGGSAEFWVHFNHQLLAGEAPNPNPERDAIVEGLAQQTGLPADVLERYIKGPISGELRSRAASVLQNKSE